MVAALCTGCLLSSLWHSTFLSAVLTLSAAPHLQSRQETEPRWREQPEVLYSCSLTLLKAHTGWAGAAGSSSLALPHFSATSKAWKQRYTGAHQMTTASQAAPVLCPVLQVSELATATAVPVQVFDVNRTTDTCLLTDQFSPLSNFSKKI